MFMRDFCLLWGQLMTKVVLQPCGEGLPAEHYADTVEMFVPLARMETSLQASKSYLPSIIVDFTLSPHFHFELYLQTFGRSFSSMFIQV
jgi:hypothetical protein